MNLEELFDVDISEDEFDEMMTVGDIVERLKSEGIEEQQMRKEMQKCLPT
ncbi:MAG: hypothetical protein LUD14_08495 [Clostridiales bacterium]|nr:hypothetical protein [Clostridiales bacterium]